MRGWLVPKTLAPGRVDLPGAGPAFVADVVPDVFDSRDLEYRPRLQPLGPALDRRPDDRYVMTQVGSSCTGHAVAAMVNAALFLAGDLTRVSPYMLYRLARRYDEFAGEQDDGSSLRGALKGWFNHGVLPVQEWPSLDGPEPDIDEDERLGALAMRRPLGAFYRVSALRLDDVQSAVGELGSVVASAAVHDGWRAPVVLEKDGQQMHVIERRPDAVPLGGHAFAVVGYNQVGFLVHNSWGTGWGKGGFATLPYDDWLGSVYDAWVARPGVPSVLAHRRARAVVPATVGQLASGPAPDQVRLSRHVLNVAADGSFSRRGRATSSPLQLQRMVQRMRDYHDFWRDRGGGPARRVVLYAPGGPLSERPALSTAQAQLNWWLNNGVYPITLAWQWGTGETMLARLAAVARPLVPAHGVGVDLVEQLDRRVELEARRSLSWAWQQAARAAAAVAGSTPGGTAGGTPPAAASLLVDRLAAYVRGLPVGERAEIHLVGHSAGAIVASHLLARLAEADLGVESLTLLAPALRVDDFEQTVLPHLRSGRVARFAVLGLDQRRELDDVCAADGLPLYQKSMLTLVSRALEPPGAGCGEVAVVGMQRFVDVPLSSGETLGQAVAGVGGALLWSQVEHPASGRTQARSHLAFDEDGATMTAVMLRVLGRSDASPGTDYTPYAALTGPAVPDSGRHQDGGPPHAPDVAESATPLPGPVTRMAEPQTVVPDVPATAPGERLPEDRLAPESSSALLDALAQEGWHRAAGPVLDLTARERESSRG